MRLAAVSGGARFGGGDRPDPGQRRENRHPCADIAKIEAGDFEDALTALLASGAGNAQWSPPERILFGAHAIYRDARFRDADNLRRIDAGWSLGGRLYWESSDKRLSASLVLDDVLSAKGDGVDGDARVAARASYRF